MDIDEQAAYEIDWNKLQTLDQAIAMIRVLAIGAGATKHLMVKGSIVMDMPVLIGLIK